MPVPTVLVYGKEHTFLDPKTGLLFRNSSLRETAPLHTHTFYEFFLVASGSALHLVNNAIQTVAPGDLLFIRPADTHSYEFYCSEDFRIVNLGFSRALFGEIRRFLGNDELLRPLLTTELPPRVSTDEATRALVLSRFTEIGSLMETADVLKTVLFAKCCLADVLVRCFLPRGSAKLSPPHTAWFDDLLTEMQKIDNLRLGYPQMLALACCSPNHLDRMFQSRLSVTPTEYINEKRLTYSVYLLTQTDMEILGVCEACGFASLSHFYHLFKKRYQRPPDKFRKALRKRDS